MTEEDHPAGSGQRSVAAGRRWRRAPRPRHRSRRRLGTLSAAILATALLAATAVIGVAYNTVELPTILPSAQATKVTYQDGRNPVAVFASENRSNVRLDTIPVAVQNTVVAAEDAGFRTNDEGVSLTGIGRAFLGLVTGDRSAGGGSTITQQYVRNALDLTRDRSYARKGKELILARKLARSKSKEAILEGYLNTIYFGRRAFGLQAAALAYFGVDAKSLTVEQGAVLAAAIKDPTNFDPRIKPDSARGRWTYVLNQMVKSGFLSAAERDGLRYPETLPRDTVFSRNKELRNGWQGVLGAKVENELRKIIPEQQLYTGGYTVTTTLDHTLQNRAAAAARSALTGQDKRMSAAVVAVAPDSGKVRAYYGGEAGFGNFDPVGSPHPTGASFKPYLLAAELTAGRFPSYPGPDNLGVYVQSEKLDLASAARLAGDAGITAINGHAPRTRQAIRTIATGQPAVTVLDQAAGYATIASGGVARQPYLIETVTAPDGTVVWRHDRAKTPAKRAFDAKAGELTSIVLQKSYLSLPRDDGLSLARDDGVSLPLDDGPVQELGGQSGSADGNTDAWMCGFSPSLATAVWIGGTGDAFPLRDAATGKLIGGSSLPSNIFLEVMDPSDGRIARPTK